MPQVVHETADKRPHRRGWAPTDEKDFSPDAMAKLEKAAGELAFLLDHDYPRDSSVAFVGNRYQFSARQRLLLARAVCGDRVRRARAAKMVSCDGPWEGTVLVDGFNVIISLEVAFSHSPVILAEDGAVRDLAGLQGTYHPIDATGLALEALFSALVRGGTSRCVIYLDQPVSNSGRLAGIIRERAATCAPGLDLEVELMKNPDALLSGRELVISNDSYVLDACKSWIPLERTIVCGISDAWLLRPIG